MKLENRQQVENTRIKLRELEEHRDAAAKRHAPNDRVGELTLRSLNGMIKQLKEEIILFECHERERLKREAGVPK